jgi:hypothetical protein
LLFAEKIPWPADSEEQTVWRCPQCNEWVDRPLAVCWQCGTARDGTVNPYFHWAELPESETGPDRTPFQFGLRTLLVFVTLFSLFLAAWRCMGGSVVAFLGLVILTNLFSAAVGIVVTLMLPKPDDSGNYP